MVKHPEMVPYLKHFFLFIDLYPKTKKLKISQSDSNNLKFSHIIGMIKLVYKTIVVNFDNSWEI